MAKTSHIMVCVTGQLTCERLIRAGAALAEKERAELSVVHVSRKGQNFLGSPAEGEALEYLFSISKEYGADMALLRDDDTVGALAAHAKRIGATHIVVGVSGGRGESDFSYALRAALPHAEVFVEKTV